MEPEVKKEKTKNVIDSVKRKEYYENFKAKRDINEKVECTICGGSYSYFTKSMHNKTKKHKMAVKFTEKIKELQNNQNP